MKPTAFRSPLPVLGPLVSAALALAGAPAVPAWADPPPSPTLRAFESREATLTNGLYIALVNGAAGSGGVVLATFDAGEASLPAAKAGTAVLAARCLRGGSRGIKAGDLEERLGEIGARLVAGATEDVAQVGIEAPPDRLEEATVLLAKLLESPVFPESLLQVEKEKLRGETVVATDPEARARSLLARILYDSHPYIESPTATSIASIKADDLRAFQERWIVASNASVVIAGEVRDDEALLRAARRAFERMPTGEMTSPRRFVPPPHTRRRVYLVHVPGSAEAAFAVGNVAFRSGDPDELAAYLLARILGGDEGGRLRARLVDEGKLARQVTVGFDAGRQAGLFIASAAGDAVTIDSCAVRILAELERGRYDPPVPGELDRAEAALAAEHAARVAGALGLAREVAEAVAVGRSSGWSATYQATLERVGAVEVGRAGRRLIRPYTAPLVFAGDGAQLASRVERFGEVHWFDAEGEPLPRSEIPGAKSSGPTSEEGAIASLDTLAAGESRSAGVPPPEAGSGAAGASLTPPAAALATEPAAAAAGTGAASSAPSKPRADAPPSGSAADSTRPPLPSSPPPLDPLPLRGGESANYQMLVGGLEIGTLTTRVSEEEWDERPVFACHGSAEGGLHLEVSVAFSADSMGPLSSRVAVERDSIITETTLQYGSDRVWGRSSTSAGEEKTIEAELVEGTIDAAMVPYAIRALPLDKTGAYSLRTWSAPEAAPVLVHVVVGGLEEVAERSRTVVARRVIVSGGGAAGTYYIEDGPKRRIVKAMIADSGLTFLLK